LLDDPVDESETVCTDIGLISPRDKKIIRLAAATRFSNSFLKKDRLTLETSRRAVGVGTSICGYTASSLVFAFVLAISLS
jgi:hypothetical protein